MPTSMIARARRPVIALAAAAVLMVGLVPAVGAADPFAVTTPYPSISVAPGSSSSFDLTVTTPEAGTADLTVSGAPTGWKATLHGGGFVVSGVTATPDKPGTARLDVEVPADTTATKATLTVDARLSTAHSAAGTLHATLQISISVDTAVAGDMTVTTTSPTLTGSSDSPFTFDLTFQNGSAEDKTVSATATGPAGWTIQTKLSQANAASTIVKAGSSTTITVTATPPSDAQAGHTDLDVIVTANGKQIPGKLGIDITGSFTMSLSTPGNLLSAHGSAGSESKVTLEITNTGTGTIDGVSVTATPPTGWTVTFDPKDPISIPAGTAPGTITATIIPSAEAVAGDYVVTFNATSTASGTSTAAKDSSDIRFTVETSPLWAVVGIGVIVLIILVLFYVFRTYGRR